MTFRAFFLPIEEVYEGGVLYRGPAYLRWRYGGGLEGLEDVAWSLMDYGLVDWGIVLADVDATQRNLLNAQPDVILVPADLDAKLTAQEVAFMAPRLEARGVPADWLSERLTVRRALRAILGLFQFMQVVTRIKGDGAHNPFADGVDLEMLLGDIPPGWRAAFKTAAEEMGFKLPPFWRDYRIREFLYEMGREWVERPVMLGRARI
jgi:hypothetical protein